MSLIRCIKSEQAKSEENSKILKINSKFFVDLAHLKNFLIEIIEFSVSIGENIIVFFVEVKSKISYTGGPIFSARVSHDEHVSIHDELVF